MAGVTASFPAVCSAGLQVVIQVLGSVLWLADSVSTLTWYVDHCWLTESVTSFDLLFRYDLWLDDSVWYLTYWLSITPNWLVWYQFWFAGSVSVLIRWLDNTSNFLIWYQFKLTDSVSTLADYRETYLMTPCSRPFSGLYNAHRNSKSIFLVCSTNNYRWNM